MCWVPKFKAGLLVAHTLANNEQEARDVAMFLQVEYHLIPGILLRTEAGSNSHLCFALHLLMQLILLTTL